MDKNIKLHVHNKKILEKTEIILLFVDIDLLTKLSLFAVVPGITLLAELFINLRLNWKFLFQTFMKYLVTLILHIFGLKV
jgi:hypothetical protein